MRGSKLETTTSPKTLLLKLLADIRIYEQNADTKFHNPNLTYTERTSLVGELKALHIVKERISELITK